LEAKLGGTHCPDDYSCYAVFQQGSPGDATLNHCFIKSASLSQGGQVDPDAFGQCLYSDSDGTLSYLAMKGDPYDYGKEDAPLDACPRREDYDATPLLGLPFADLFGKVDQGDAWFVSQLAVPHGSPPNQAAMACARECRTNPQHQGNLIGTATMRNAFIYLPNGTGSNVCQSDPNLCQEIGITASADECVCFYRKQESAWPLGWSGNTHCFKEASGAAPEAGAVFAVMSSPDTHDMWPNGIAGQAKSVQGTATATPNCGANIGSEGSFCASDGDQVDGQHFIFQTTGPNNKAATYIGEVCIGNSGTCNNGRNAYYMAMSSCKTNPETGRCDGLGSDTYTDPQYNHPDIPDVVWDQLTQHTDNGSKSVVALCVRGVPQ